MAKDDDDRFVTIRVATDPVEAEMLRDILAQEGIPATIQGSMHAQLLGAAGTLLSVPVQVPASRAAEAKEIVDAIDNYDAVLPDGDDSLPVPAEEAARRLERLEQLEAGNTTGEGPYREGPSGLQDSRDRRRKVTAGAVALVLTFGSGHFYARDYRTGIVLALCELVAFVVLWSGDPHGFYALLLVVSGDFLGAMAACDRANGAPASVVMRGAPWLAITLVVGLVVTPWMLRRTQPETFLAEETEILCRKLARCSTGDPSSARPAEACTLELRALLEERELDPVALDLCADCVAERPCNDVRHECADICPIVLPR